jgi:hypothetical protein
MNFPSRVIRYWDLVQINLDPQYIVCSRKIISNFYTTYGVKKYFAPDPVFVTK